APTTVPPRAQGAGNNGRGSPATGTIPRKSDCARAVAARASRQPNRSHARESTVVCSPIAGSKSADRAFPPASLGAGGDGQIVAGGWSNSWFGRFLFRGNGPGNDESQSAWPTQRWE